MATLNKKPGYEAQLPRTAHDISRQLHYTSSVAMMLPVYHHPLNPSDHIECEVNQYTRSLYLNTASLAQIDFKIDAFFVPITMLYTPFENIFYGTKDFMSSAAANHVNKNDTEGRLPLLDFDHSFAASAMQNFLNDYPQYRDRYRLLMHLGYNPNVIWHKIASSDYGGEGTDVTPSYYPVTQPNLFPYPLLAYHAIYNKHYRLEEYQADDYEAYNWDNIANDTVFRGQSLGHLGTLHKIPRYFDYFTRVKVSPLASAVGTFDDSSSPLYYLTYVNNFLAESGSTPLDNANDSMHGDGTNIYQTQVGTDSAGNIPFSTGTVRNMFAVEKLMRIFGRAKKNYDSQILAHFGWQVPHDVKHQITYLGSFNSSLDIHQITATADTENAALGSITGTGDSKMSGRKIKFTAPVHGMFMLIAYARPKTPYETLFEKVNQFTTRIDFPQPEFDHLGMQPLFEYEAVPEGLLFPRRNYYLGWQYRYEQFKSKYDKYTVAFADPTHRPAGDSYHSNNAFQTWITGRLPFYRSRSFDQDEPLVVSDFLVSPHDIDQIMAVPYSDEASAEYLLAPWLMFQTDPFIHWLDVHCTLTSFMSKYGEPELD